MRLLKDVVATITTMGSDSPEHTRHHVDDKEKRRRSHAKSQQRVRLGSKPSSLLMQLAVEALARQNYAAGLVRGAFHRTGSGGDRQDGNETLSRDASETFDVTELDAVMQSLLSCCARDLQRKLWGGEVASKSLASSSLERSCNQRGRKDDSRFENTEAARCPYSRLLLVLQEHVVACWSNTDGDATKKNDARELSLAHASRLLERSLEVFTRLLAERDQHGSSAGENRHNGNGHPQVDAVTNSFVSLVPVLCTSVAALPTEDEGFLSRAAGLLPLIVPLMKVVDRFNRSGTSTSNTAAPVHEAQSPPGWITELEEALAMLSSDLVCGLIDMKATKVRQHVEIPPQEIGGGGDGSGDGDGGGDRNRREAKAEDIVELLLASSPFLAFGRESFDWSALEDRGPSQLDSPDCVRALEVNLGDNFYGGRLRCVYVLLSEKLFLN